MNYIILILIIVILITIFYFVLQINKSNQRNSIQKVIVRQDKRHVTKSVPNYGTSKVSCRWPTCAMVPMVEDEMFLL